MPQACRQCDVDGFPRDSGTGQPRARLRRQKTPNCRAATPPVRGCQERLLARRPPPVCLPLSRRLLHFVDRSTDANLFARNVEICSTQEPAFALENRHPCAEPTPHHLSEFRPVSIVSDAGDEVDHHFSVARLMRIWRDSLAPRVVRGRHKSTRFGLSTFRQTVIQPWAEFVDCSKLTSSAAGRNSNARLPCCSGGAVSSAGLLIERSLIAHALDSPSSTLQAFWLNIACNRTASIGRGEPASRFLQQPAHQRERQSAFQDHQGQPIERCYGCRSLHMR